MLCEAACAYMFRSQIAGQPHGASEDLSPAEGSLFFGLFLYLQCRTSDNKVTPNKKEITE